MTEQTRQTLDNAYEVFENYETPRDFVYAHGIPHWPRNLTVADLWQLDDDNDLAVRLYEKEVLLHLLPRWLELLSEDETRSGVNFWNHLRLWTLKDQLNRANWQQWPAPEVAALRAVFLAWTREDVESYGGEPPLEFLTEVGEDLAPHLELWLDANPIHLAQWLWKVNWNDSPSALRWAVSSRLESELEAAFFAAPDGPNAELFSRSVELVRSLRAVETAIYRV